MPKRCALGCPYVSGKPYHQFPHAVRNPDRFKAWVCIVGGKLDSQDEIELYRKKVLCDVHFTDMDKNRNNRLNFLAVPTLHLDGKPAVDSSHKEELPSKPVSEEGSCSMFRPTVTDKCTGVTALEYDWGPLRKKIRESSSDHDTSTKFESQPILDLPSELNQYLTDSSDHKTSTQVPKSELISDLPSISYEILIGLPDYKTTTHVSPVSETVLDFPSPISKETFTFSGALDISSEKTSPLTSKNKSIRYEPSASRQTELGTIMCPDWIKNNSLKKEHSYCAQDKTDITKAGESKYHQPIPPLIVNQLQTARKRVKQLQSEVIRLRKRNKVVTTRLINVKKNSKHNCLQKITQNMTAAAKSFTHMQFTQTKKRSGGRRFTLEGQQLCHSIYKCSPQCYDLLSKVFTLPSAKTLKRFIRKQFDIQPGLNNDLDGCPIQPGTF